MIGLADYQNDGTDVQPVSDPMAATTMLSMAKSQALLPLKGDPTVSNKEINKRYLDSLELPNTDAILVDPPPPQPDPEVARKAQEAASNHMVNVAKVVEIYSNTVLNIAKAEGVEVGSQLGIYKQQLEEWISGQTQGMEAGRGNGGVPGVPQAGPGAGGQGGNGAELSASEPIPGDGIEPGVLQGPV